MAQRFWTNQVVRGARHRRHGGIPGDERSGNDRAKRKTEAENAWRVMLGAVLKLKKPPCQRERRELRTLLRRRFLQFGLRRRSRLAREFACVYRERFPSLDSLSSLPKPRLQGLCSSFLLRLRQLIYELNCKPDDNNSKIIFKHISLYCAVVYYAASGQIYTVNAVRESVTSKTTGDARPLCYCFGFTEGFARREIAQTGESSVSKQVSRFIKEKLCGCEIRNPSGVSCLGEINRTLKRLATQID